MRTSPISILPPLLLSVLFSYGAVAVAGAEGLKPDATWSLLRQRGKSIVFGRLEGRFDGSDYRGRKIRVRNRETREDHLIAVDEALGSFEAVLPMGVYDVVAIEAMYVPNVKPLNPSAFPPVRQRYAIRAPERDFLPSFAVGDRPVYLGTIRSSVGVDGTIYEGHALELVDDYDVAWRHLRESHPVLAESLDRSEVSPRRDFFLEPGRENAEAESVLALDSGKDPLGRARLYIREGKFREAIDWLSTSLPTTDGERAEMRLLGGEALLGDRRYAEAVEELGEALLAAPENERALRLLARAHAFNGDADDAVNLYRALSEMRPGDAEASLHLGYYHALRSEAALAKELFSRAFESNFDYLLHDSSPYALALRAENARYQPPEVLDAAAVPGGMRSRRSSRGAFAILLDSTGKVVAAQLTPGAESWAPAAVMALVRARFRPATLNGVPIPCLVIVGAEDVLERERRP
jgi:tetratricopeptide (TPR) repeat protein